MFPKVRFWAKCISIAWNDRKNKPCRQKFRRIAREFEKANT